MLGISKETEKQLTASIKAASLAKTAESLAIASSHVTDRELAQELLDTVARLHKEIKSII